MSSVFSSDIFDWARDLAIIQRLFGPSRPDPAPGSVVQIADMRGARPRAEPAPPEGDAG